MSLLDDVRLSFRTLRKNPGFTAVAVTMLAVGIGVNATVFTVTNAVLFKGFPLVLRNDRLVYISNGGCCISYPDFEDIRAQAKSFEGMGITHGVSKNVSDESGFPERVEVTEVSTDTFPVTGVRPILGRDFTTGDEVNGAAPVAILNYGFWERRYGKDPAIVGKTVRMNGAATTLIGIMPEGYTFPQKIDVWVPLVQTARVKSRENADTWFAFGRLVDGVSFESGRAEVEGIIQRLEKQYPLTDRRNHLVVQHSYEFLIGAGAAAIYGSMWGAVGFVLLIACANLANLMLARAMGRSREISVRIALGAGRWRIVRQLLIESLMLSGLGGFCGWWIARWGVHAYALAMANKSPWLMIDYSMDRQVLGYLIASSVGTGILFGLVPALRLSRLDVNASLKDGGRGATGGSRAKHLSAALVAGEMALAVVLLAGAGVTIRSFLKIHGAGMGVTTANVVVASVELPPAKYGSWEARNSFYQRLTERLKSVPGVESVALAETLPSWGAGQYPYELAGGAVGDFGSRPKLAALKVSAGYFATLGARVLAGREFNEQDGDAGAAVAIVNQLFASQYWPGENAVGKRLRLFEDQRAGPWLTVVGVVSNITQRDMNRQRVDPLVYLPYKLTPGTGMWTIARTQIPAAGLANAYRQELKTVDADVPMYGPLAMSERLERFWDSRFYGTLFLIFAGVALLLASIGLYTVIAHAVSGRTQEIGIRMAVGASARDILSLVIAQGTVPLGIGLVVGLAASLGVNRILRSVLVQVSPGDPVSLAMAAGVLIFAAGLGCVVPARRAMRVDPVVALRNE